MEYLVVGASIIFLLLEGFDFWTTIRGGEVPHEDPSKYTQ